MTNSTIGILLILLVLIGGYWLLSRDAAPNTPVSTPQQTRQNNTTSTPQANQQNRSTSTRSTTTLSSTVRYTDQGFVPASVTIQNGGTVTWIDDTRANTMWVASADHPTHAMYSGTNRADHCPDANNTAFDQCQNGEQYTFTFNKAGTWNYHNHSRANATGSVTVTP